MAVVGFDVGNLSSYVAVARGGGIETVANEYSDRMTPSIVGFGEKQRSMGNNAKTQQISNIKNTITDIKRFLGRTFKDPAVQEEIKRGFPFKVVEGKDGRACFQVRYAGEEEVFTPEQVMAILLTKLKETAEMNLSTKVLDCVISVPQYFTDQERRAVLASANIAGLNCSRILNDTTATALAYGIYKQDLPAPEEKPRNVVFVDMGHSSLQVSACAFNKGKLKVLAMAADRCLGGRDFDNVLFEHLAKEVLEKNKLDIKSNAKATVRLRTACERVKKLMSSNTTRLPINVESIMNDRDISAHISRAEFEELAADLLRRVEIPLRSVLKQCDLKLGEIHSVEIVGGSSRIPAVKEIIKSVFQKDCSTTLNQDEAVARGCAVQCATLSPTFRVREFQVKDLSPYGIKLLWKVEDGEMEVSHNYHSVPFTKELTFWQKEPFQLEVMYSPQANIPYPDPFIGNFLIKDVKPNEEGKNSKVTVTVKMDGHGIFSVISAHVEEKKQLQPKEKPEEKKDVPNEAKEENGGMPMDTNETKKEEEMDTNDASNQNAMPEGEGTQNENSGQDEANQESNEVENDASENKDRVGDKGKKGKKKVKMIEREVPVESNFRHLSDREIQDFKEREGKMTAADKLEKDKNDAKNAVEEFVYDMRSKLCEMLVDFVTEQESEKLNKLLNETEDWLYDEGEDVAKSIYVEKLEQLRKLGSPIIKRYQESLDRPVAFEDLGRAIVLYRKFLDQWKQGEKYSHIEKEDVEKVEKIVGDKESWRDKKINAQNQLSRTQDPVVVAAEIRAELQSLTFTCEPIISKPKPKPKEEPPKEEPPKDEGAKSAEEDEGAKSAEEDEGAKSAEEEKEETMEIGQTEETGTPVDSQKPIDTSQEAMEID